MTQNNICILFITVLFLVNFTIPAINADDFAENTSSINRTSVQFESYTAIGISGTNSTDWDNKTHTSPQNSDLLNISIHTKDETPTPENRFQQTVTNPVTSGSPVSTMQPKSLNNATVHQFISNGGLIYRSKSGVREVFNKKGKKIFTDENFQKTPNPESSAQVKLVSKATQYGSDLSERAINGQFDQVTETYEQEILNEQQDIWWPPYPEGWSFSLENGPEMFWEPDDWDADHSNYHATVIFTHTGDYGTLQTTLDATGGQYIQIITGPGGNENLEVYLDNILLGNITEHYSSTQFDISNKSWTRSSTLKIVASGDQWTNNLVRSISLMAKNNVEHPTAGFNGTPISGITPLNVSFTDTSTGSPTSWNWSFGDGTTSISQDPLHTYSAAGTYDVGLTVANAEGHDTSVKTGYITVKPVEYTYSMTCIENYDNICGGPGKTNCSIKGVFDECDNVARKLNATPGWKLNFYHKDGDVTSRDFSTQEDNQGLTGSVFHYHSGHGIDRAHMQGALGTMIALKDYSDILAAIHQGGIFADDVNQKWGGKNKWVALQSCNLLRDQNWGKALTTSHGILGYSSSTNVNSALPELFFEYVIDKKYTVISAYMESTKRAYHDSNITAAAITRTVDQWNNDQFPGIGYMAPDGNSDDNPIYYEWNCSQEVRQ